MSGQAKNFPPHILALSNLKSVGCAVKVASTSGGQVTPIFMLRLEASRPRLVGRSVCLLVGWSSKQDLL